MLIAGDVGGTQTDLAIFSTEAGPYAPLAEAKVHSVDYPNLQAIVKEFLAKVEKPVSRASFAVAGPVINGRARTTKLPRVVEGTALAQALNLKSVDLIDELGAVARALPVVRHSDVQTIDLGDPVSNGAIAFIAPGTGLGESRTWEGTRYLAHGSEGADADFAPTDEGEIRLLEYLLKKFDHVSFEHVCSGIGIPNIHDYLRDIERIPETPEVSARIAPATAETIGVFVWVLASEPANLAVKVSATGGVHIVGGVAMHTVATLRKPAFMQSFKRKGRFANLIVRILIHVVVSKAGLAGVAAYRFENSHLDSRDARNESSRGCL